MNKFVRSFFRSGDDNRANLTVDILIDDRRHLVKRIPYMGCWGRIGSNNIWPFVYKDGELDFGNTNDEQFEITDRFGKFDLDGRIIAINENFGLHYCDEFHVMTLEKITDIAEL